MNELTEIEIAAQEQNGWTLLGAVETDPGGDGTVPNGIALIKRHASPFGEGREYGTARWYIQPDGAGFESGNYDLTREDALADFIDRAKGI